MLNKDCWIIVYYGDNLSQSKLTKKAYLPIYPESISDTQGADWTSQSIVGRSNPIAAYIGTNARSVSFTLSLHRELLGSDYYHMNQMEEILEIFRMAVFPKYCEIGLIPPRTRIVIGELAIDGVLESANYTWKPPIIDKKYMACDVEVHITGYPSKVFSADELGSVMNPHNVDLNDGIYTQIGDTSSNEHTDYVALR